MGAHHLCASLLLSVSEVDVNLPVSCVFHFAEKMIQNKSRRFRPVGSIDEQLHSGNFGILILKLLLELKEKYTCLFWKTVFKLKMILQVLLHCAHKPHPRGALSQTEEVVGTSISPYRLTTFLAF